MFFSIACIASFSLSPSVFFILDEILLWMRMEMFSIRTVTLTGKAPPIVPFASKSLLTRMVFIDRKHSNGCLLAREPPLNNRQRDCIVFSSFFLYRDSTHLIKYKQHYPNRTSLQRISFFFIFCWSFVPLSLLSIFADHSFSDYLGSVSKRSSSFFSKYKRKCAKLFVGWVVRFSRHQSPIKYLLFIHLSALDVLHNKQKKRQWGCWHRRVEIQWLRNLSNKKFWYSHVQLKMYT